MAAVEYDLDLSGGLMEQIQKLVSPPESELPQRKHRMRGEYRRQGRSVNRDCCDSCKEGGDLLCCDRCPAAFHLQCHDPPLEEENLPTGEWICHKCRVAPMPLTQPDDDALSTCSSHSRRSHSSSLRRHVLSSQHSHTSSSPSIMDVEQFSDSDSDDEPQHPLMKLAKAAKLMNPKQMELAKDIGCHIQLPGSSKRKWPYRDWGRGANKKQAHELDNGMVPLPAKLCFTCNKSCRKGPLIQCDFCPLLFHLDCLDPPATTLPSGRWMCPNHVEHTLDEKLLQSVRLTERVKLWDKYTGPINQHATKIKFLNKIHRQNPPFRIKVRHQRQPRACVPAAIKAQYIDRAQLLTRATDVQQVGAQDVPCPGQTSLVTSQEEQEEWLAAVVSLQTSIARHLAQQQAYRDPASSATISMTSTTMATTTAKPTASVQPVKQERPETLVLGTTAANTTTTLCAAAVQQPLDAKSVLNSKEMSVAERVGLLNGALSSPSQDQVPNGPVTATVASAGVKSNGPVSLLQPGASSSCTPNGDMDLLKSSDLLKGSANKVLGTTPGQSVVKLTVPCTSGPNGSQSRNIVISTVNKSTGALSTKLVSAASTQGSKVLVGTPPTKTMTVSSNPTSILSPRVSLSTNTKVTGTAPQAKVATTGCGGSTGSKVITVPTPTAAKSSVGSVQTKSVIPASLSSSPAILNLNSTLQACIEGSGEVELGKLDERLVQILAWQRLQQLLPQKATQQPTKKSTSSSAPNTHTAPSEVRARALLCPLTGKGQPVPMPYRTLTIGTGGDMGVCLSQFGHCNYISAKHACIFYDETTRHYELLNYSEHGTTVDNVLYSCDFSEKVTCVPQPTTVVNSVRRLIQEARGREEPVPNPKKSFMCAHTNEVRAPCSCKASSSSLIGGSGAGWEGTALLHHGSYIKVGCLQFVFSIVEQAVRDPCIDKKPAGTSLLKATLRSPSFST